MDSRTVRQRHGARAEDLAAAHLQALGWRVIARGVRIGRDEIDILAIDPGPPVTLVAVEVRSAVTGRFGAPEESVNARKLRNLYRGAAKLRALRFLPGGEPIPRLTWRVDLVAVDVMPQLGHNIGGPTFRHLRALSG
ncbi:MAG: YraN family protein [Chloroflexi bacterium]|nr:YraN family protein [Chloroflexota bacterium]HEV8054178.1 YraN family protein [Candidatus Limnocylindrales bacterium]